MTSKPLPSLQPTVCPWKSMVERWNFLPIFVGKQQVSGIVFHPAKSWLAKKVDFFKDGHALTYTPENQPGTHKWRFRRWFSFSKRWFSASMLVFGGKNWKVKQPATTQYNQQLYLLQWIPNEFSTLTPYAWQLPSPNPQQRTRGYQDPNVTVNHPTPCGKRTSQASALDSKNCAYQRCKWLSSLFST